MTNRFHFLKLGITEPDFSNWSQVLVNKIHASCSGWESGGINYPKQKAPQHI